MSRLKVSILDVVTQELTVREMNDEEHAQHLLDVAAEEARNAE